MVGGLQGPHQLVGEHVAEQHMTVGCASFAPSVGRCAQLFGLDYPDALERIPARDTVQWTDLFEPERVAEVEGGGVDSLRSSARAADRAALPADQLVLDGGEIGLGNDAGGVFHQLLAELALDVQFEFGLVAGASPREHGLEHPDPQAGQGCRRSCREDHAGIVADGRDVLLEADVAERVQFDHAGWGDDRSAADGAVRDCSAFAGVVVLDGERVGVALRLPLRCDVGDGDAVTKVTGGKRISDHGYTWVSRNILADFSYFVTFEP